MATVQSMMLDFLLRVDPYDYAGNLYQLGTVGVNDGAIVKQRQLDIYNEARRSLFIGLKNIFDKITLTKECGGIVLNNTTFQFTQTGAGATAVSTATKPAGYIEFVSLLNAANTQIILLPIGMLATVLRGSDPHYTQSASNIFAFDIGAQFIHYGDDNVPSASTYKLQYIGLTTFLLADVTGGATLETFDEKWHPILLQLAEAIANELGSAETLKLAETLVKQFIKTNANI